ncbi:hypothetical protein [Chitinimonas koreensis]|uniref:hypothetical protein n=1 Tax=Chitinimonas koreensis TaxID=356302 RepID=UPI000555BB32|nr:hypothetical protein [Chitinimonas koreensis]QNM95437.1 hypothetical protein H9L41_16410 [Chitinimonas koreensis]
MKRRWVALSVLASLVLGAASASWFWLDFGTQFREPGVRLRAEADIVMKIAVLHQLRAGRAGDATYLLEKQLDGDLLYAATLARDGQPFGTSTGRAVARDMTARASAGRAPAEDVRDAVQQTFHLTLPPAAAVQAQPAASPDPARTVVPAQ